MSDRYISLTKSDFLGLTNVKQKPRSETTSKPAPQIKSEISHPQILDYLYRKHYNNLCGFLRRRYGNGPPDPEDVAQTTFERISELEGLNNIRNPRGFLFTIAGRIFIDRTRRRAVSEKYINQQLHLNGISVEEITPERVYKAREDFKVILKDLESLSPIHREVVLRHRILGQTYDEISCATELSPASISRYLKAAMAVVFNNVDQNTHGKGK